jgi:pimeloyl-ACP methyl ester carboxylesterase
VDAGGYRVHLYCAGTGSPAVIIAGAGYSFDWGLVQPEVAKFTEVCAYDHSGIGWSDSGPADSCALRVHEIHTALRNAGVKGPYVLVGHSLGALVVRLYAAQYPDETAGLVFADHAFIHVAGALVPPPPPTAKSDKRAPVLMGMDDDPNFKKLPPNDQQLHLWAESQSKNKAALRGNMRMVPQCAADTDEVAKKQPHPLGNRPLVDISTDRGEEMPGYAKLQSELLSLSNDSKQIVAKNSGHFVIIDRPDVVVDGIRQVVDSVRIKGRVSDSMAASDHKPQ